MIPGASHITLYQGDDYSYFFRLRSATWDDINEVWVPGAYLDLTNHVIKAQVRKSESDESVMAEFTPTLAAQSGATLGGCLLTLSGLETAAVQATHASGRTLDSKCPNWVWDVQITAPGGLVDTYLKGKVRCEAQVTR
jgi:hypothetical protein